MKILLLSHLVVALSLAGFSQTGEQQWTERGNHGFEGPVKSVLTSVESRNPDPRPPQKRTLGVGVGPQWIVFDPAGTPIEQGISSGANHIETSKRTLKPDGTEVWTDSSGRSIESRKKETRFPDGTREVKYFTNSKLAMREVSLRDEQGRTLFIRTFDDQDHLSSEQSTKYDVDPEITTVKIYDEIGHVRLQEVTRVPHDPEWFDRSDRPSNRPRAWSLSEGKDGQSSISWYAPGYTPKFPSSDSLGFCRPKLCGSFKFDDSDKNESGEFEKLVQRTPGYGTLEPDNEEHYNSAGVMDEKLQVRYTHDSHGNWIERTLLVWDSSSKQMIEVERDSRTFEYY